MGVKNPQTYGDHYWAAQVEAEKVFQDGVEDEVSSYVEAMYDSLGLKEVLPEPFSRFVGAMTSGKSFAWGGILARFGSEMADSVLGQSMGHALKDFNYMMAEKFSDLRITASEAAILHSRRKIDEPFFLARALSEGLKPAEAAAFYGSRLPYPAIPDIVRWARYHGDAYNIRGTVWEKFDVPVDDMDVWDFLGQQVLSTGMITKLFRRNILGIAEAEYKLGEVGFSKQLAGNVIEDSWLIPNAMLLVQGSLLRDASNEQLLTDISIADIHPDYAEKYLDGVLTKPSSQDLVAYELRRDPNLNELDRQLKRVGIHPDYTDVYKELAQVIPPVADIITMAVREAFTPSIAAKFGQYQDFPDDLAVWGAKKGLSEDWTKRYWAAHWSLPSANQGFEMLHRGVITLPDLNMLLRALDIMPFWRDRLLQIAYRRLTRVDIRRMYSIGVLTEDEVYDAYSEQGYNERDSKRMTAFTIKQTLAKQSKFTASQIVAAFAKYMINSSEAKSLLQSVGVRDENISFIISSAEYKRSWELTESRIAGIRNYYKKELYDENTARGKLLQLNLPSVRVDALMSQWFIDGKDKEDKTWTAAQTLGFIDDGLISPERGRKELKLIGYDDEHINVYLRSL